MDKVLCFFLYLFFYDLFEINVSQGCFLLEPTPHFYSFYVLSFIGVHPHIFIF